MQHQKRGFTLLELLIAVSIIAVLLTALILASDPRERLKEVRDSRRLQDIATLNKAIGIMQAQAGSSNLGSTSTTYLSLPDASSTCGTWIVGAGSLSFTCAPTSSVTKIDGTGWIPVNFATISGGSPLGILPIDPVNNTSSGLCYTFTAGEHGTWKITAGMESLKYIAASATDGGLDPLRAELGSKLNILGGGLAVGMPVLWLSADQITGVADGHGVASWTDQSGYGNSGTGEGDGETPMYLTNMINSKPAVRFSAASSTYFSFADFASHFTEGEIFVVLKNDVDNSYNGFYHFGESPYPMNNAHYGYFGTIYDEFGSNTRYTVGDPPGTLNTWHMYNVSTAPGSWTARFDGSVLFHSDENTVTFTEYPYLGMSPSGIFLNGEIAEVIMYNSVLSPEMRELVQGYLQEKYGL
jgi:prepilin-type N-terminal cleavage/methylation domain-containing protein